MPTGYTAPVEDGTITEFKDFALFCARVFGALVMMRDEPMGAPIPDKLDNESSYHTLELERLGAELAHVRAMSEDGVKAAVETEYLKNVGYWAADEADRKLRLGRDQRMLQKVRDWVPPSPEHQSMKGFMQDQLISSAAQLLDPMPEPRRSSGRMWQRIKIASLEREIDYHTEKEAEAQKRSKERQEWLDALRSSLP